MVERLSQAARLSFIDLARFCCASFIVLARPRPPAPQSFDTRLPHVERVECRIAETR
jgi:hypothetical protein